jgi:hypothetical protein
MTHLATIEPAAPNRRSLRASRVGVEVFAAIFILSLTVPWQPASEVKFGPIDFSWMLLVHHAIATGMQFGKQIIMPEGPLAFIGTDVYDARTYPALIIARTLIALAALWSLLELGRRSISTPSRALIWLIAIILLMGVSPDCFYPDCAILLLLNYFLVHGRRLCASAVAMLIVLAAASLIKANQVMYAALVTAILTADQAAQRRSRSYLPAAIYLIALASFYLAARQSPRSVGSFVWGWWHVLVGHAQAAALAGPVVYPLAFVLAAILVVAIIGRSEWKARRWAGMALVAGIAATLLLLYKHSFVRQDAFHVPIAPAVALALLIMYLPVMWQGTARGLRGSMLVEIALCGTVLWSALSSYSNTNPLDYTVAAFRQCGQNVMAAVDHIADPDRQTRESDAARREVRLRWPLPRSAIVGTVDVYPHRQDLVFAYALAYAPRPVCCSFLANIPVLASINARYLASPAAPQTILFDIDPVDQKYPTLLDGASLPELLARYDLIDDSGAMLILRRAAVPRRYAFSPLAAQTAQFDQPIAVPSSAAGMIWVRIEFRKRAIGKLVSAIYRPAILGIVVDAADGARSHWHLLPDLAEQGFLLSPLIDDRGVLADLYRGSASRLLANKRVKTMTISVDDGSRSAAFDPDFTVTFQRLHIVAPAQKGETLP